MIGVKFNITPELLDSIVAQLEATEGITDLVVEDPDDQKLKPMSVTDFYKKINAANLAITEKRRHSQRFMEEEVQKW